MIDAINATFAIALALVFFYGKLVLRTIRNSDIVFRLLRNKPVRTFFCVDCIKLESERALPTLVTLDCDAYNQEKVPKKAQGATHQNPAEGSYFECDKIRMNWKLNPMFGVASDFIVAGFAVILALLPSFAFGDPIRLLTFRLFLAIFLFAAISMISWSGREERRLRWEVIGGNVLFGFTISYSLATQNLGWEPVFRLLMIHSGGELSLPPLWLSVLAFFYFSTAGPFVVWYLITRSRASSQGKEKSPNLP